MTFTELLLEVEFKVYTAMIKVVHVKGLGAEKLSLLLRSLPGVVRVSSAGQDKERNIAYFNVKLITQRKPSEAFHLLRKNAIGKFNEIKSLQINFNSIEGKG